MKRGSVLLAKRRATSAALANEGIQMFLWPDAAKEERCCRQIGGLRRGFFGDVVSWAGRDTLEELVQSRQVLDSRHAVLLSNSH